MAPTMSSSRYSLNANAKKMKASSTVSPVAKRISTPKVQPGIKDRVENFLANASPAKPNSNITSVSRKRKITSGLVPVDEDATIKKSDTKSRKTTAKIEDANQEVEEKRARLFRKKAPKSFLEKLSRAQTQRMIVIGRKRVDTAAFPKEEIDIVGSTGNIYRVTIDRIPSCTCPDHQKGHECKHKVYALHTVLKAPEHLQYQLAFLSSELSEIFAKAPPLPTDIKSSADTDGRRKPVEGACPICYMDFEESKNDLVWCEAACGNNMHKTCFDQWAASQRGATICCVYCRTPWQMDYGDIASITQAGSVNEEGYVNVAEQFGMSRARDYSTYHQPWVRQQFGMGW